MRSGAQLATLGLLSVAALLSLAKADAQTTSRAEFEARQTGSGGINCTIRPSRTVDVSAGLSGIVKEVMVRPGQYVEQGSQMIQLDAAVAMRDLELSRLRAAGTAGLARNEALVSALTKTVARLQRGFARRAVSAADLEAAKRELSVAQADLDLEAERLKLAAAERARAEAIVAQHTIAAPVSGQVGETLINPGEATIEGPIATIYVNDPLRVEAFVPAQRLEAFLSRDTHQIVVNGRKADPVTVKLDYAAPIADLASNTISVYFSLSAPSVLPGSKCLFEETAS